MPTLLLSRAEELRETNRRMRFLLDTTLAQQEQPAFTTPEQMAALLSELLRAGAVLRAEPLPAKGSNPELETELHEYRRHVERLRELLPSIHHQLLAERARLETQRNQVRSAAEWARASRQTL
jgi:hypothetical protein